MPIGSQATASDTIFDKPSGDFVTSLLPLYSGPQVTIRIGSPSHEYKLSKALLCKQSEYFRATFNGGFQEGQEQATTLQELDGVVSVRSFELLVQWLYLGRVILDALTPTDSITAIIEFVRIADMCGVTGMESVMAQQIKAIILLTPAPAPAPGGMEPNTNYLTSSHIASASNLSEGHPVRKVLAAAVAREFFIQDNDTIFKEAGEVAAFVPDILEAIRDTIKSCSAYGDSVRIIDPLSGRQRKLRKNIKEGI